MNRKKCPQLRQIGTHSENTWFLVSKLSVRIPLPILPFFVPNTAYLDTS